MRVCVCVRERDKQECQGWREGRKEKMERRTGPEEGEKLDECCSLFIRIQSKSLGSAGADMYLQNEFSVHARTEL